MSYKMQISLNVLNHLGIGLYSNIPSVLSEIVANAWDADATEVNITIDSKESEIRIQDNGHGMSKIDLNDKFLHIGYSRRSDGRSLSENLKRPVMGRKGIGKLSVFSISDVVEVYSKTANSTINGFKMEVVEIKKAIQTKEGDYSPVELCNDNEDLKKSGHGTIIILKALKKNLAQTESFLKKRLARRFSIIGASSNFIVKINNTEITLEDRDYFSSLEYIWEFGQNKQYMQYAKNATNKVELEANIEYREKIYTVRGWIGTVKESGKLQDGDENLNKISILVRGKVAQEDILEEFREGGMYTKYVIGEISADFLDLDEYDDIATSSRQKLIEDDERYKKLKDFILKALKGIEKTRAALKETKGEEEAIKIQPIKVWYDALKRDQKVRAKKLFGRINQIETDESHRKVLYKHAVLAFENMSFKDAMDQFDALSSNENIEFFITLFKNYDDIESTFYYEITSGRLKIIKKLKEQLDNNDLERVLQMHIFENLWLLDPSWERATEPVSIEQNVQTKYKAMIDKEPDEIKNGRIDLKYRKTSGKHIIIELKRATVRKSMPEIMIQVIPYIDALKEVLALSGRHNEPVEAVFIMGVLPKGWDSPSKMDSEIKTLETAGIRVLTYQSLIDQSFNLYSEYLDKQTEKGKLITLLHEIDKLPI